MQPGDELTGDLIEYGKERIRFDHANGEHSYLLCDTNSCATMAKSHKTDHKQCQYAFCDVAKIRDAHHEGRHNIHCAPDNCAEIKKSHETSHYLCKDTFCDSTLEQREKAQWMQLSDQLTFPEEI